MTSVTQSEWLQKAENFQARIKDNPYPVNTQWYQDILARVQVGMSVLDVGAGMCYPQACLPPDVKYLPIDPFPRLSPVLKVSAEDLIDWDENCFDTAFCFATLDNVRDLTAALKGINHVAKMNVVIVTGIGIEPDDLHTVMVTRKDLTDVFGEPMLEVELTHGVYLFDFVK